MKITGTRKNMGDPMLKFSWTIARSYIYIVCDYKEYLNIETFLDSRFSAETAVKTYFMPKNKNECIAQTRFYAFIVDIAVVSTNV